LPAASCVCPPILAVAAAPEAFCSAETSASAVTVRCLDEQGRIDARRLEAPAGCVDIVNDVGTRDLEPLRRDWQASASGCADGDASSTRVPVVLELTPARMAEPWPRTSSPRCSSSMGILRRPWRAPSQARPVRPGQPNVQVLLEPLEVTLRERAS